MTNELAKARWAVTAGRPDQALQERESSAAAPNRPPARASSCGERQPVRPPRGSRRPRHPQWCGRGRAHCRRSTKELLHGWQQQAAASCGRWRLLATSAHSARIFAVRATVDELVTPPPQLRILLLRGLRNNDSTASSLNSRTCRAPRCCSRCAPPHGPTMYSGQFSVHSWRGPRHHTTQRCGRHSFPVLGGSGAQCERGLAGRSLPSGSGRRRAPARGLVPGFVGGCAACHPSSPPPSRGTAWVGPFYRPRMLARACLRKDGWLALPGRNFSTTTKPAPYRTGVWATGPMAGSTRRRILATLTFATACCCRPCPPTVPGRASRRGVADSHPRRQRPRPAPGSTHLQHLRGTYAGLRSVPGRFWDHATPCPRTGLFARRARLVEHASVQVAREAIGSEGKVVPQQWLTHTTAPA